MSKKKTHYISDIDRFIQAFDRAHLPSPSQQATIKKHQAIAKKRDVTCRHLSTTSEVIDAMLREQSQI